MIPIRCSYGGYTTLVVCSTYVGSHTVGTYIPFATFTVWRVKAACCNNGVTYYIHYIYAHLGKYYLSLNSEEHGV